MGLMDGVLGDVLGGMMNNSGQAQGGNPLLQMAMQLFQQHGGLAGIVDLFRKQGLAQEADSWVSTGANLPISPEQLKQVMGGGAGGLAALASQLGLSEEAAGNGLAQALPELINQLTPDGRLPANANGPLEQLLGGLAGKFFAG